jgi:dihydropyrimidine dehydrogenase (NAD+) subunit PreA
MLVEFSLSCPQGGDGTEGDIVSQSPVLTAKIVDWVMQTGRSDVPKLFKLTGAVTSIAVILAAIRDVLDRYPGKMAGVTLANTFPVLDFRPRDHKTWDQGIVFGMSGAGVAPISYLTLATASRSGLAISGNGGPMDYLSAAHFLALGAQTVQFCTVATKHGVGIIDELHRGLSHLMQARGLQSVEELVGCALPHPVTDFMDLDPAKKVSHSDPDLCLKCGNCTRCPYLAISLTSEGFPHTDPALCIGCGICAKKCFSGAIHLRNRTPEEADMLSES